MKYRKVKRVLAAGCAAVMTAGLLAGCGSKTEKECKRRRDRGADMVSGRRQSEGRRPCI